MLIADSLRHQRNGMLLFSDVCFTVNPSELVKITGGNGCGKSTLLKVLCQLLPSDSGEVRWQERDVREDADAFREQVLYVGHANALADDLTPLENLRASAGLRRRPPRMPLPDALTAAGLGEAAHRRCRQLSAGQRRRAALARLQAFTAPLWLLDEPLAALDGGGREMLSAWLEAHLAAGGMAVCTMHCAEDWDVPAAREVVCRR